MKIKEIYDFAVELGRKNDIRTEKELNDLLKRNQKEYEELKEEQKKEYDKEKLTNPYSDTRILYGDENREVKRILVGIDMEIGEVMLADRLSEKGKLVDLIIAHHPEGKALAALHEVMHLQEDMLLRYGVPINVAEGIMSSRISEVKRNLMPLNHNRAVDAAKILGIPIMCIHTPADNMVSTYLQKKFDEKKPKTLDDVVKLLKEEPEYSEAVKHNAGPVIIIGNKKRRAGKVFVDMTGGTGGSERAYEKLAQAGVGTVVVMHIGEKHRKEAEKHHINVIIAGHMASDSIGMNLILDKIEDRGVEVLACSGLMRYKR